MGSSGEATIERALEKLGAGSQKGREDGLTDLKGIFSPGSDLGKLNKDIAYHHIFEALFRAATAEKQAYLSAKTTSARTKAETNLSNCSDALRLVIRAGWHKIRAKTLRAVVEHVTQLLPAPHGEYCAGLTRTYFKILVPVLQHEAYIEQLGLGDWQATVDFCLQGIQYYCKYSATQSSFGGGSIGQSLALRTSSRNLPTQQRGSTLNAQNAGELMECLLSLVAASNSPTITRAESISNSLIQFLQSQSSLETVHKVAFQALNHVLCSICGDRLALTSSIALQAVPAIARLWSSRASTKDKMLKSARDQMLITFIYLERHLEVLVASPDNYELLGDLEVLKTILTEYSKRVDDSLLLTDLDLGSLSKARTNMSTLCIGSLPLKTYSPETERNWALLYVLNLLDRFLHHPRASIRTSTDANQLDDEMHPRKRRRAVQRFDTLIESMRSFEIGERIMALQMSIFVVSSSIVPAEDLSHLLGVLLQFTTDSRNDIGSWAILAIAVTAQHLGTAASQLSFDWIQLWHTTARLITNTSTCRAACHLLHSMMAAKLVAYRDVLDDVDAILTATDIRAPALVCDSSLSLMSHLLQVRHIDVPSGGLGARQQLVIWLASKWPSFAKSPSGRVPLIHPADMLDLLRTSLDQTTLEYSEPEIFPTGIIGQSWRAHLNRTSMLDHLLLLDTPAVPISECRSCPSGVKLHSRPLEGNESILRLPISRLVMELFVPKFHTLVQELEGDASEQSTRITRDSIRTLVSACVFGSLLQSTVLSPAVVTSSELPRLVERLREIVCHNLRQGVSQEERKVISQVVGPYLPAAKPCELLHISEHDPQLLALFISLADLLAAEPDTQAADDLGGVDSLDDIFELSQSNGSQGAFGQIPSRTNSGMASSDAAFNAITHSRLTLISSMAETGDWSNLPSSFVDHIKQLNGHQILLRKDLLVLLLQGDILLSQSHALTFIGCFGQILQSPEYVDCEVALALCLEMMVALVPDWTSSVEGKLSNMCVDLYDFFVRVLIPLRRPSPGTQIGLAKLFFELMRARNGCEIPNLPSPRTSLLSLLKEADLQVKFQIGNGLPRLFELYVLKLHNDFLLDIVNSLPSEFDWLEGILFRVFVLGKLASSWPTLLRSCIYYILEVPGHLPAAAPHATRSLSMVSEVLKLGGTRDLFRLFASQLLYTWLEEEDVDTIPFMIFGYRTLRDLVADCQDEIAGILTMRNQDERLRQVANILETSYKGLLESCFTKIIAYSVAHDISVPHQTNAERYVTGEARVRKALGKPLFFELVNRHFADIIALFFKTTDQLESIDKSLSKQSQYHYAAANLSELRYVDSPVALPPNQQPAFKAKYLADQIEHICKRTQFELGSLYTSSLVVFVARSLLSTTNSALGSLHSCMILRQLRILISLSNKACLEGYCLEMLLQSVAPFMTDSECADDAIGIVQYLFKRGTEYLKTCPSFVAGISLSMLASLRVFIESTPASTTLDSQYRSTLSKAQTFHTWFGRYLEVYQSPKLDRKSDAAFRSIVTSAHSFGAIGNAYNETPESTLLIQLFEDQRSGRNLLNKSSKHLAFSLLFSKFKVPRSFRDDILGSDDLARRFAVNVWNICQDAHPGDSFLVWAAKVLGRAFAASGLVKQQFIRESTLAHMKSSSESHLPRASRSKLLSLLQGLTLSNEHKIAGLAEATLRVVMAGLDENMSETEATVYESTLSNSLLLASTWIPYQLPPSDTALTGTTISGDVFSEASINGPDWLKNLAAMLSQSIVTDPLLVALPRLIKDAPGFAEDSFPFILHLALKSEIDGPQLVKKQLSKAMRSWFKIDGPFTTKALKDLINALLYLRTQPIPRESSSADRMLWLDLEYFDVAAAAFRCGMVKTALLFLEVSLSEISRTSTRRSSSASNVKPDPTDLLLSIFKKVDDPDLFYGLQQSSGLDQILSRLEYEKNGSKSLAFRSALYDTHLRNEDKSSNLDAQALVGALGTLGLDGLSHSIVLSPQDPNLFPSSAYTMFHTARKLEQWDLPVPLSSRDDSANIYKVFQTMNTASDHATISKSVDVGIKNVFTNILGTNCGTDSVHRTLQSLAVMTEIDELLSNSSSEQFEEMLARFQTRAEWMELGRFDDIRQIISCRETLLSSLNRHPQLRDIIKVNASDARLIEVQTALLSASLCRSHGALQESLTTATYLNSLISPCSSLGLNIEAAVRLETANALWDQEEITASIGILRGIESDSTSKKQTIPIGRPSLLAKLGSQVSVARLEKSAVIVNRYLEPALKELKGNMSGSEAAHVFHEFAVFCDEQLQDPDNLEDLARLKRLKEMKESEVADLGRMVKAATSAESKQRCSREWSKQKIWFNLDNEEYMRQVDNRQSLLRQSLENYLLSLTASDDHNNDALRFSALWLDNSDQGVANDAVSKYINQVPSRKFAPLMNQLTSRLLSDPDSSFQKSLFNVVLRICSEHPYHGMYQIWAGCRNRADPKDEIAVSRLTATQKVGQQLAGTNSASIWSAINSTSRVYCQLAAEKDSERYKSSNRIPIKSSQAAASLNNTFSRHSTPPPTMHIGISPGLDYSHVPAMEKLEPMMTIASGVSAPKIITVLASNGARYKQLVKGGTDDLRQDAIMEQVFGQVSELLKRNTSTRQRSLGIRTYKVLPLSPQAGIIEFVPNSIPLHDYLMPAHERYYPKDLKGSACRKLVSDVAGQKLDVKVRAYRNITERFHPVLRYFFMEKYHDPEDWFEKRTAYTRSTASTSILGHVLGLGDRHGHNILLDEQSGEVIHIDLGIAFEMGRVLPIPELIPFRMTRDTIDGMGVTKMEGVFRRCCEFTLEALRKESSSIMAILDVLKFDPLYSWSISPVRLAKLQSLQSAATPINDLNGTERKKSIINEPSEADRALTVVKKKLSKALSVTATVNDLINQATDEKNLASLYSGWAAYA